MNYDRKDAFQDPIQYPNEARHGLKNRTNLDGVANFLRRHSWFALLVGIEVLFFLLNFQLGKFYANSDITLYELHPFQELTQTFSMWQYGRGFGLELGLQTGWIVPLSFFAFLSYMEFNALQINLIYNFLLFVGPGIATFVLARTIFYRHADRNAIAFFAGLLTSTSFGFMIYAAFPLLGVAWPTIVVPFMLSSLLMILQTGGKRYWLAFVFFCYLNWASFTGPNFLVFPFLFAVGYILYYLIFESHNKTRNTIQVALAGLVFFVVSLPIIYAVVHLTLLSSFFQSPFQIQYTTADLQLNLSGLDNSAWIYGIRLIGSLSWSEVLSWTGQHYKAYYEIFTFNPIFIAASFLLPILAFASLLWKNDSQIKRRIVFLSVASLIILFFLKGTQPPLGGIFQWLISHVSAFSGFREPYPEIVPALCYSLSILGAYTLVRIFHAARGKRHLLAKIAVAVIITALIVDAYPIYSGEVTYPAGFFNLPNYYQSIATSVNSNSSVYKILGLPETYYENCYSWGYCGVDLDGMNLNKPVILESYVGSDVYDESMMNAVLNEVKFNSFFSYSLMNWGTSPSIFSNANTLNQTINLDRVAYWAYLLRSSNVGQLIFRHDSTGAMGGSLNSADWYKYNTLFSTLVNMSLIHEAGNFGNLTLYNVDSAEPIVYSSSINSTHATNSYDSFLDATYTDSRLHVLSSYSGYNQNTDFVSEANPNFDVLNATEPNMVGAYIYAPIPVNDYINQVNNEISLERSSVMPDSNTVNELTSLVETLRSYSSPTQNTYIDYIQQPGNLSVFIRASPAVMKLLQNQSITFNNNRTILVNESHADANGWYRVGDVKLDSGPIVINSPQLSPSSAVCTLSTGYIDSYLTSTNAPESVNVWNYLIHRYQNSSWSITTSWGGILRYPNLCALATDPKLDSNFRQQLIQAFGLNHVVNSNYNSNYNLLLTSDNSQFLSRIPSLSLGQISSTEYYVTVRNATAPFFLNFLESYNPGWIISLVPSNSSFSLANGFMSSGDLSAIVGKPVFSQNHYLLNGFANSWYINPISLAQGGLVKSENGSYNFVLLISYQPEAYFAVLTIGTVLGTLVILALIFRVEIANIARRYVIRHKTISMPTRNCTDENWVQFELNTTSRFRSWDSPEEE